VQLREAQVVKEKTGRRVPFDRDQAHALARPGVVRKRPVEPERIERMVSRAELESLAKAK